MSPKTTDPKERITIGMLAEIINREAGTIRKWEHLGKLPKKLHPTKDHRGWRWWTHAQVYGKGGIIEWMEKNDMRPGKVLSQPENADQHVRNLRRPKYMNKNLLKLVKTMVKNKATAQQICAELHPHTKYSSEENMEAALRRYFNRQGWYFPPPTKRTSDKK